MHEQLPMRAFLMSGVQSWRVAVVERTRAALQALFGHPEPVEMVEQRFNFLPRRFRWRGALWRVREVARSWEQPRRYRRAPRRYFQVICQDGGSYTIYQDLHLGAWYLG